MEPGLAAAAVAPEVARARAAATGVARRAVAIAVAVLCAGVASAQASPIEDAAAEFREGLAKYQSAEYADAARYFAASYELDPRPDALFAWAQAARLSGDCAKARELYDEFLDGEPREEDAEAARNARALCAVTPDPYPLPPPTVRIAPDEDEELADDDEEPEPEPRLARSRRPATRSPTLHREVEPPVEPSDSRMFAFARVDIDASGRGGVFAPGVSLATAGGWEGFASALLGGNRGIELGGRFADPRGRLRPFVTAALPIFLSDGTYPLVRGSLGVRAPMVDELCLTLEFGGAYALAAPEGADRSVGLVSLGIELSM